MCEQIRHCSTAMSWGHEKVSIRGSSLWCNVVIWKKKKKRQLDQELEDGRNPAIQKSMGRKPQVPGMGLTGALKQDGSWSSQGTEMVAERKLEWEPEAQSWAL
jgi:hypothetical protein